MYTSYKKSNFGGAFFFLDTRQKETLSAVYAFCRAADDIADEGYAGAPERLDALRAELTAPKTPLGMALAQVMADYPGIKKQYFDDLLDAMTQDLKTPLRLENTNDLMLYMYRVAGVVGLMCIEIFGYKNQKTKDFALTLGYAVQLTNILRDIEEDAKINRVYIPKEDLRLFGLTADNMISPGNHDKLKNLMLFEAARAEVFYNLAAKQLPPEDFKAMLPARAMGNIYRALLDAIQKNPCRQGAKKIKLNKLQKIYILYKTWRENP